MDHERVSVIQPLSVIKKCNAKNIAEIRMV